MQQDIWTNTKTSTTSGVTGPFGSPRGWLRRALNEANLDFTTFHETSITPYEISVAGIWYLPATGLPETGNHRELIRWFDAPTPEHLHRAHNRLLLPAIGIAAAVPMPEIMFWLKTYRDAGAAYTWWKTPENKSARASDNDSGKPKRRQLDHSAVYNLLESGMRLIDISKKLDIPTSNIDYIARKWRASKPLIDRQAFTNQAALIAERRSGVPVSQLAIQYNVSEAYIYSVLKKAA